jgi:hypothetical protein
VIWPRYVPLFACRTKVVNFLADWRTWPNIAQLFWDRSWGHGSILPFI